MLVFVQYVIEIIQLEGMGIRVTSSWVQHVYECRGGSGGGGGGGGGPFRSFNYMGQFPRKLPHG